MKMDMTSGNPCMWDSVAYRVKFHPHVRTGAWLWLCTFAVNNWLGVFRILLGFLMLLVLTIFASSSHR